MIEIAAWTFQHPGGRGRFFFQLFSFFLFNLLKAGKTKKNILKEKIHYFFTNNILLAGEYSISRESKFFHQTIIILWPHVSKHIS